MSTIFGSRARFGLMATSALVAAIASPAWAQSHSFNVAAQPAQSGIAEFARQADVQILVTADAAKGLRTNAVKGQFDTAAGLKVLLKGTGLEAKATGEATFAVVRAQGSTSVAVSRTPTPTVQDTATSVQTVVVTGRVGVDVRTRADTSYSVSIIPQEHLRETGVSSLADSVRNVPGFWVENSGGEASANVRARGIPVDGFASVQVEEDGMPVQHDPGLGYLNVDQSFRLDETISQIQVVRGGPSTVFASNAPGGVINYITRKPTEEFQGLAKLTLGDDGLYRGDFWVSGAVGGGWTLGAGGFYRLEDGVRYAGFPLNDGGQFRVNAAHDLGNGKVEFDFKHIDDKVGFYLPIPIAANGSGGVTSVPGFNASTGTMSGPAVESLKLLTPNGNFNFNLNNGTEVKLDQFSAHLIQNLDLGWTMDDHFRMRSTTQNRIAFFASVVSPAATLGASLLPSVQAIYPTAASVQFRYSPSPSTFLTSTSNGNGLAAEDTARQVSLTEREVMNDLRFSKKFDLFGQTHDVSIGGYVMAAHETFDRYAAVLLTDVKSQANLLDAVAVDANGNTLGVASGNSVVRAGSEFANGEGNQQSVAAYFADEWQVTNQLRVDVGARFEQMHTTGTAQGSKTVNLGLTNTLADKSYIEGNGVFTPYSKTFHDLTWTVGANWQFDPAQGLFARYTRAARMPSISDYITNPTNTGPVVSHTDMYEAGYKFSRPIVDLYLTLFDTDYHNYSVGQTTFNAATSSFVNSTYFATTRDYGVEFAGDMRPLHWFSVPFSGTLQNPTFTSLKYTVLSGGALTTIDYNGNQLLRIPKYSFTVSPTVQLLDKRLRAQVSIEYYSDRYADAANSQLLPAYTVVNFNARYKIANNLTFYASGYNLTNEIGLTEGNPRSGEIQSSQAGQPVFLARPIEGRTFRMSLLYTF